MKRRWLAVAALAALVASVWAYDVSTDQLNNSISLQLCARRVEQEKSSSGSLPRSISCSNQQGEPITYLVRDGTYVLVGFGSDGEADANYGELAPADIPRSSTCFSPGADTVFVGNRPVRYCLK